MNERSTEKRYPSARTLLIAIITSVAAIEVAIMLLLQKFDPFESRLAEALFNGVADGVLIFPFIFYLFYRPMQMHISERKNVEEELRQSSEILENRVVERTRELTAALEKARKEVAQRLVMQDKVRDLSGHVIKVHEEERKRIAMELHDEMGQSLAALKLQIHAIAERAGMERPEIREECTVTLGQLDRVMENIHNLYHELTPVSLTELGLEHALSRLVHDGSIRHHLKCKVDIRDVGGLLDETAELQVYRIFQEALTNIGRHAGAQNIEVLAKRVKQTVVFRLEDDGQGMGGESEQEGASDQKRLGLVFMEERARLAKGRLQVDSDPGKGTTITITLPVHESVS